MLVQENEPRAKRVKIFFVEIYFFYVENSLISHPANTTAVADPQLTKKANASVKGERYNNLSVFRKSRWNL